MKKALSLLLAFVLCLPLCACGDNNGNSTEEKLSQEDMLVVAQTLDASQYLKDYRANPLRAKENYVGKVYRLSGVVSEINDDYCEISYAFRSVTYLRIDVYFDKETLMNLTVDEGISFIGEVSDLVEISQRFGKLIMKDAYYISDKSVLKAKIIDNITTSVCVELLDSEFRGSYAYMDFLSTDTQASKYQTGDIVYIEGVLGGSRLSSYCGKDPDYRIISPKFVDG